MKEITVSSILRKVSQLKDKQRIVLPATESILALRGRPASFLIIDGCFTSMRSFEYFISGEVDIASYLKKRSQEYLQLLDTHVNLALTKQKLKEDLA